MEEDLLEIKDRLCGVSSELQIIPIVGMGGIGKTTLARYAYDDSLIVHRFDVRVWVTISQSYDFEKILDAIYSSILNVLPSEDEGRWPPSLEERVYRHLKWRRFLIVMDDMWDRTVWDDVRRMFPNDSNGSRIMITTRNLDVASYVDTWSPHKMRLMAVDQSWSLLKEKVFGIGHEDCPLELQKVGRVIAEKCKGLPLAILVIGGVLSKLNQMKDTWEAIARNISKVVNTSDEQLYDVLSLSYKHLPLHLRYCFLYMGCFPEDYEINASMVIRLWAAEGFLISNESKDMEEVGHAYLKDLSRRSLVLIEKKGLDGKIKAVKIHDALRDLCIRKSRDEDFLCIINEFEGSFPHGIEYSHRLSICSNIYGFIPNVESSPAHTILVFKHWAFGYWKSFRLLTVVHALNVTLESWSCNSSIIYIGGLIHLRYLAISCEAIIRTCKLGSESLYQLQNLQTLIVKILGISVQPQPAFQPAFMAALDREDLPQSYMIFEIWRMPQLRHLILLDGFIPDPYTLSCQETSVLENLHTLSRIQNFKCSERILVMIPNLKKLGIIYSYRGTYETGWSEFLLNNLAHLHMLEKLSLYAEPYPNLHNNLSQNISFPETLKKLTLSGCRFPWEDMRMIGSLPNLEVLKLMRRACYGTEWETSEGEFCQLKVLLIDSTDLHQWISDSSSFPRLERLTLYECGSLREVPNDIGDIPTLQLIEVDIRDLYVVESAKCIEEEQKSSGNDLLQVRSLKSRGWRVK